MLMVASGGVIKAIAGPAAEQQVGAKNGAILPEDIPKISDMSDAARMMIATTAGNVPAAAQYNRIHRLHLSTPLNIVSR